MLQLLTLLHTPTLQVATAIVLLLATFAASLLWLSARTERYAKFWAAGYFGISLGLLLVALRGQLPVLLTVVAGNAIVAAGGAWLVNGTAIYCRRDRACWPVGIIAAAIAAAMSLLVYGTPNFQLRVTVMGIYMAAVCATMVTLLWRHPAPGTAWLQRLLASLLAIQLAFYLTSASRRLLPPEATDYLDAPVAFNAIYLNAIVIIMAVLFCFWALTHRRLSLHLRHAANHDPLTGALNRRAMDALIDDRLQGRGATEQVALVLLDLDHFKKLNDEYGHQIGDVALVAFANTIQSGLRKADSLGRIGGEEFCLLLPNTDAETAWRIAERLRTLVESIVLPEAPAARLTVSAGVASSPPFTPNESALLRAADEALYRAKAQGRNQVVQAELTAIA